MPLLIKKKNFPKILLWRLFSLYVEQNQLGQVLQLYIHFFPECHIISSMLHQSGSLDTVTELTNLSYCTLSFKSSRSDKFLSSKGHQENKLVRDLERACL